MMKGDEGGFRGEEVVLQSSARLGSHEGWLQARGEGRNVLDDTSIDEWMNE